MMPNRQEIEISISATGEVQLKVLGAPGTSCLELTKDLEESLGVVIAREKTSEYYSEGAIGSINLEGRY